MSTRLCIIIIWVCFILLLIMGIMMVASTGSAAPMAKGDATLFLGRQGMFAMVGLVAALCVSQVDYHIIRKLIIPAWIGMVVLLVLCYVPGVGMELNGERRWIGFGSFSFQPSELAKIVMIASMAHWYTTHREIAGTFWRGFAWPGAIFGIPLLLILFEKDMGTAAALGVSCMCVMLVSGARGWLLALTLLLGAVVLYEMATGNANRLDRIHAWMDPELYSTGAGRQQWIAFLAFERGALGGVGLGDGIEKYGSLPFAHTDFIYAAIGEEWGFAGAFGVLMCFTFMTIAGVIMALQTQDTFGRIMAAGLVCIIFWPAVLNMMVVTSVLPNSGLPLPFISYGGTNLVFTIFAIGLLTSIQRFTPVIRQNYWPRHSLKQNFDK